MDLPAGLGFPVTIQAGGSGLHSDFEIAALRSPAFSPDGSWIAFPAQDTNGVVEVFVARRDGRQVLRATDLGQRVQDYTWLDKKTLVVEVHWPDGTFHHWIAQMETSGIRLTPLQDVSLCGDANVLSPPVSTPTTLAPAGSTPSD
jgi:hypothetical protein